MKLYVPEDFVDTFTCIYFCTIVEFKNTCVEKCHWNKDYVVGIIKDILMIQFYRKIKNLYLIIIIYKYPKIHW